jgi:hypothetical protein
VVYCKPELPSLVESPLDEKIPPMKKILWLITVCAVCFATRAHASEEAELAKKISDPISHLASVPFQFNYDENFLPNDGYRWMLNFQPVVPFDIGNNWSLITRTIVPFIYQDKVVGNSDQFGLGDIEQSFFFKPNIWPETTFAFGPVFLYPSATDSNLGSEKFGFGPTAILVQHAGPWVFGLLANHIWSVAGTDSRDDVSKSFTQPFIAYHTSDAWTFNLTSETSYDWTHDQASVPLNFTVSKMVTIERQPVQFFGGLGYWAEHPDNGPKDWRVRFGFTLVFPEWGG